MKRRRFFGLLGAVVAAPAVAKVAEPKRMVSLPGAGVGLDMDGNEVWRVEPQWLREDEGIITGIDRNAGVIYASADGGAWSESESDYAYYCGDAVNLEVGDFLVWEDIE